MKILFATIEHSGTRFTMNLLNISSHTALELEDKESNDGVLLAHLTDEMMPLIRDAAGRMPVITTHREGRLIEESWVRRGKDLAKLTEQRRNHAELLTFHPAVISMWGGFHRLPPYSMWFSKPTPQQIDEILLRRPRFM